MTCVHVCFDYEYFILRFFRFITDLYELWGTKGRIFPFDFIEAYIIHNQNGNALQWNESE